MQWLSAHKIWNISELELACTRCAQKMKLHFKYPSITIVYQSFMQTKAKTRAKAKTIRRYIFIYVKRIEEDVHMMHNINCDVIHNCVMFIWILFFSFSLYSFIFHLICINTWIASMFRIDARIHNNFFFRFGFICACLSVFEREALIYDLFCTIIHFKLREVVKINANQRITYLPN